MQGECHQDDELASKLLLYGHLENPEILHLSFLSLVIFPWLPPADSLFFVTASIGNSSHALGHSACVCPAVAPVAISCVAVGIKLLQ